MKQRKPKHLLFLGALAVSTITIIGGGTFLTAQADPAAALVIHTKSITSFENIGVPPICGGLNNGYVGVCIIMPGPKENGKIISSNIGPNKYTRNSPVSGPCNGTDHGGGRYFGITKKLNTKEFVFFCASIPPGASGHFGKTPGQLNIAYKECQPYPDPDPLGEEIYLVTNENLNDISIKFPADPAQTPTTRVLPIVAYRKHADGADRLGTETNYYCLDRTNITASPAPPNNPDLATPDNCKSYNFSNIATYEEVDTLYVDTPNKFGSTDLNYRYCQATARDNPLPALTKELATFESKNLPPVCGSHNLGYVRLCVLLSDTKDSKGNVISDSLGPIPVPGRRVDIKDAIVYNRRVISGPCNGTDHGGGTYFGMTKKPGTNEHVYFCAESKPIIFINHPTCEFYEENITEEYYLITNDNRPIVTNSPRYPNDDANDTLTTLLLPVLAYKQYFNGEARKGEEENYYCLDRTYIEDSPDIPDNPADSTDPANCSYYNINPAVDTNAYHYVINSDIATYEEVTLRQNVFRTTIYDTTPPVPQDPPHKPIVVTPNYRYCRATYEQDPHPGASPCNETAINLDALNCRADNPDVNQACGNTNHQLVPNSAIEVFVSEGRCYTRIGFTENTCPRSYINLKGSTLLSGISFSSDQTTTTNFCMPFIDRPGTCPTSNVDDEVILLEFDPPECHKYRAKGENSCPLGYEQDGTNCRQTAATTKVPAACPSSALTQQTLDLYDTIPNNNITRAAGELIPNKWFMTTGDYPALIVRVLNDKDKEIGLWQSINNPTDPAIDTGKVFCARLFDFRASASNFSETACDSDPLNLADPANEILQKTTIGLSIISHRNSPKYLPDSGVIGFCVKSPRTSLYYRRDGSGCRSGEMAASSEPRSHEASAPRPADDLLELDTCYDIIDRPTSCPDGYEDGYGTICRKKGEYATTVPVTQLLCPVSHPILIYEGSGTRRHVLPDDDQLYQLVGNRYSLTGNDPTSAPISNQRCARRKSFTKCYENFAPYSIDANYCGAEVDATKCTTPSEENPFGDPSSGYHLVRYDLDGTALTTDDQGDFCAKLAERQKENCVESTNYAIIADRCYRLPKRGCSPNDVVTLQIVGTKNYEVLGVNPKTTVTAEHTCHRPGALATVFCLYPTPKYDRQLNKCVAAGVQQACPAQFVFDTTSGKCESAEIPVTQTAECTGEYNVAFGNQCGRRFGSAGYECFAGLLIVKKPGQDRPGCYFPAQHTCAHLNTGPAWDFSLRPFDYSKFSGDRAQVVNDLPQNVTYPRPSIQCVKFIIAICGDGYELVYADSDYTKAPTECKPIGGTTPKATDSTKTCADYDNYTTHTEKLSTTSPTRVLEGLGVTDVESFRTTGPSADASTVVLCLQFLGATQLNAHPVCEVDGVPGALVDFKTNGFAETCLTAELPPACASAQTNANCDTQYSRLRAGVPAIQTDPDLQCTSLDTNTHLLYAVEYYNTAATNLCYPPAELNGYTPACSQDSFEYLTPNSISDSSIFDSTSIYYEDPAKNRPLALSKVDGICGEPGNPATCVMSEDLTLEYHTLDASVGQSGCYLLQARPQECPTNYIFKSNSGGDTTCVHINQRSDLIGFSSSTCGVAEQFDFTIEKASSLSQDLNRYLIQQPIDMTFDVPGKIKCGTPDQKDFELSGVQIRIEELQPFTDQPDKNHPSPYYKANPRIQCLVEPNYSIQGVPTHDDSIIRSPTTYVCPETAVTVDSSTDNLGKWLLKQNLIDGEPTRVAKDEFQRIYVGANAPWKDPHITDYYCRIPPNTTKPSDECGLQHTFIRPTWYEVTFRFEYVQRFLSIIPFAPIETFDFIQLISVGGLYNSG